MTDGNGAYIPYNEGDEDTGRTIQTPEPASVEVRPRQLEDVVIGCANHSLFMAGKCFCCGGESEAIVKASNKMLNPQGDPGRGGR